MFDAHAGTPVCHKRIAIMLPGMLIPFSAFIIAVQASLLPRVPCYSDPISRRCFGSPNGGPENLKVEDIAAAAAYIRSYGRSTTPARFLTMNPLGNNNCMQDTLYKIGTVRVVAKHTSSTNTTSVLFEDFANAIDGGESPTTESLAKSVISCDWKGGQISVSASATRPEYHTQEFLASGASTEGMVVMIINVQSPNYPNFPN